MKSIVIICLSITVLIACNSNQEKNMQQDFLTMNIDTSVKPGDNFFLYANGQWIKNNPIPADESEWGIANLVQEEIYKRLKTINEKAVEENAAHGTVSQKKMDLL